MPIPDMLPLGTIVIPKESKSGWEDLRYMVTGYFPRLVTDNTDYDYVMTPWPLGVINVKGAGQQRYFCCNEDAIAGVESVGMISPESCDWLAERLSTIRTDEKRKSPLACGGESMSLSLDVQSDCSNAEELLPTDILPLGSVISESQHPGRKAMIYQQLTQDASSGKEYDYCVCAWPQGVDPGDKKLYVINHDEITAVHFRGYENALSQEVTKRLEKKRRGSLFTRLFGK